MSINELLKAAEKHRPGKPKKIVTTKWLPIFIKLRQRNCTWSQIYDFLKENGETVQDNRDTFIATASRIFNNYLAKLADKAAERRGEVTV